MSRLAARFWDADRGRITVGGMDVSKADPEALLSLYSIVFQDVTLFDNTILENIRIGRKDAHRRRVHRRRPPGQCGRVCREAARRVEHRDRGERLPALRR